MKRLATVVLLVPCLARAGGLEVPDNGTEALGRGATFTAKADSPLALEYNIAGLAKQRGTKLLIDSNLLFHTSEFTRAGTYPDSAADAPYGGMPFPKVASNSLQYVPFIGLTTDFNYFDRWTFAFGVFGPSAIGNRQFGDKLANGYPSPARYDVVNENLLIVAYPTLAASVRATRWLDVGLALQLVVGVLDLENTVFNDIGVGATAKCKNYESTQCDSRTRLRTHGVTATAALGLMFHPARWMDIGVNVRGPVKLDTSGTVDATIPPATPNLSLPQVSGSFHTQLPWVLRFGIRYKFVGPDKFEHGDIEFDGIYEAWAAAARGDSQVNIPSLGPFTDINPKIVHNFKDTFSARVGGAYNARLPKGVLTFRLGFFFDSAATSYDDTRVDFDTMAKYAPTAGIGFSVHGFTLNLGYAFIYEPDRNVTTGALHSVNGGPNGDGVNGTTLNGHNEPMPIVNNGFYHAQTQIASLGIQLAWDELLKKRKTHDWE